MSQKRANLEFGWATLAGIAGWMGSNGGILTRVALGIFILMALVITVLTIHGAIFRGH